MAGSSTEAHEGGQYDPSQPQPRRVRLLMVNPPDVMALFKKGLKVRASFKVVDGAPADAKLLYISYDNTRGAMVLLVESAEYDEVPIGVVPPIQAVSIMVGGFTPKKKK